VNTRSPNSELLSATGQCPYNDQTDVLSVEQGEIMHTDEDLTQEIGGTPYNPHQHNVQKHLGENTDLYNATLSLSERESLV
jgi:hypothetical protein